MSDQLKEATRKLVSIAESYQVQGDLMGEEERLLAACYRYLRRSDEQTDRFESMGFAPLIEKGNGKWCAD